MVLSEGSLRGNVRGTRRRPGAGAPAHPVRGVAGRRRRDRAEARRRRRAGDAWRSRARWPRPRRGSRLVQVPAPGSIASTARALAPGTALANAYGHDVGIAEYVIGAMLAVTRGFCRIDAAAARRPGTACGRAHRRRAWPELAGKTLGILGYGRIGQAVARRALRLRHGRAGDPARRGRPDPNRLGFLGGPEALDEVLGRADYLAITLALTPETRGLLGARGLGANEAHRGADQRGARRGGRRGCALRRAPQRRIAGAALDVWYRYPRGRAAFPSRRPSTSCRTC